MGEAQPHIDKDITDLKGKNNVSDFDIAHSKEWRELCKEARKGVRKEISEYKLDLMQRFLFGGPSKNYGDNLVFVTPALIQIERFVYDWMTRLSEESRKAILDYTMYSEDDDRARDYCDYLKTPVWRYISGIIKLFVNYTCEECGAQFHPTCLNVHHKSYEHLGSELNHLDDLAVLCKRCHMKVHGIGGEDEQEQ